MTTESQPQRSWLAHLRHEISTPINIIIGYSELLLENLEDLELEETQQIAPILEEINKNGQQILSTVKRILDPAKLETGERQKCIETIESELRLELATSAHKAIGYCDKLISIATAELIPDLERIRKGAYQLLNGVDEIVDRFKQQIQLDANHQASTLDLFPKLVLEQTYKETISFIPSTKKDRNEKSINYQGYILVVDDNENNRDLLCRHLQEEEYQVSVAANGRQALQMIQAQSYDLILLDIIMPEMNGYQVLQWLRESKWRSIPVIMISALDELDSVVKCIEMGAEDYLPKPFNPTLLRARIGACLEKKRLRDQEALYINQLAQANREITILNERLEAENVRMSAELEVTRRLQEMILPKEEELNQIDDLEISGYMNPADEVGGDYYDVLQHNGRIKIGIGDVTGHGLESGVLMIMLQTAVRTLMENEQTNPVEFLETINRTIYKNVQRMSSDKNLTLALVDYQEGTLRLSGQHEEMIVVRFGGNVERISTIDLGFPIGLEESIAEFVTQTQINLNPGDVVVLYTDGITEAEDELGVQYGIERLCEVVQQNWQKSATEIRQIVIEDLRQYIGQQKVHDDITLLVLKQKSIQQ
jgi:serine phosphatase RsbU (regulator of sigma subunit)